MKSSNYLTLPILFLSFIICDSCSFDKKALMYLEPIEIYDRIDSTKNDEGLKRHKVEHFIVKNYHQGKQTDVIIDSLVCAIIFPSYQEFKHYDILLYKESHMTNRAKFLENDRVLVRYSQQNDWIYSYRWFNVGIDDNFIKVAITNGKQDNGSLKYLDCKK